MKKFKSIIALILVFATVFCISASAAEWHGKNALYTFDNDTGVMVIRGEGKTVTTHMFGQTSSYCYTEEGNCDCWDSFDEPSEASLNAYSAAENTRILIIEDGVKLQMGSLCHFDKLETLILPESLTVIPSGLCYNLKKLKTVVFSSSLTEIGKEAFSFCSKLTNVTIPSSVKTVKQDAFYGVDTSDFLDFDKIQNIEEGNTLIPDCLEKVSADPASESVEFYWNTVNGASGYRIFIRENNKWKKVKDVLAENKAFMYVTVRDLKPNTKYTFAVRPFNKVSGKTYWAPKYIKVTFRTTPKVVNWDLSSTKKGTAKITWTDIDGEQGYQVWYSTKSNSGFKKYSNYKANSTQATLTGLKSGQKYYFRVRAYTKVDGKYIYSAFVNTRSLKIK